MTFKYHSDPDAVFDLERKMVSCTGSPNRILVQIYMKPSSIFGLFEVSSRENSAFPQIEELF